MAKTLKIIDAGSIQIRAIYPRCSRRDEIKQRQAKHQASSAAQRRMNQIYSYQKLELMLAVNFPVAGSALVCCLTCDDKHMPKSRKEFQRKVKTFLKKLRDARAAENLPAPVAFWAPEILTSKSGRWHLHLVLDNTGRDIDILRRCWIYGSDIEVQKLRVDAEKNHETQARYMTKELRECQDYDSKPGLHGWSCTRNAKKPETESVTVDDDFELNAPPTCTVLLDEKRVTEWASYRVLKYRCDSVAFVPPHRARRRSRKT